MATVEITTKGVTHHYNPRYIKDIQEVENVIGNEWCLNIIIDDKKEPIVSILFKTKEEMIVVRDKILSSMDHI